MFQINKKIVRSLKNRFDGLIKEKKIDKKIDILKSETANKLIKIFEDFKVDSTHGMKKFKALSQNLLNYKSLILDNKEIFIILVLFFLIYSFNLDKFPGVWTDEAWFSNPAYTLATSGYLGTTMMYGFYNIMNYTYWQPPVFFLLLAVSFKLFGFGLYQARIVSVILGFFTVLFTYLLGKKLFSKKIGLLSSVVLIANPLFFLVAREVRMDIAVACFTLIALYFILIALKESKPIYYLLSSFFAILSLLSHPNGIIGIVSIVLIIGMYKIDFKNLRLNLKLKEVLYFILGLAAPLIPYLIYINMDFQAFKGQFFGNIGHSTNNPLNNIITEPTRYSQLLIYFKGLDGHIMAIILVIISICLAILGVYYVYKNRNFSSKVLLVVLITNIILLTVIVSQKDAYWYLGILLPYWSILIALPVQNAKLKLKIRKNLISTIFLFLILGYVLINCYAISHILLTTTNNNYKEIEFEVQKYIPEGSVVAGEPADWFSLQEHYKFYDRYQLGPDSFKKVNVGYILYDNYWENENDPTINNFLNENCTLIAEIPKNGNIGLSPIKIYKIN